MKRATLLMLVVAYFGVLQAQETPSSQSLPQAESPLWAPPEPAVPFIFSLTDKKGNPVPDAPLSKDSLRILDGKKPATEILDLHKADNLPVRYALVLDLSGSVRRFRKQYIALAREIVEFLRGVVRPGTDHAIVIGFRDGVTETMVLDPDVLIKRLENSEFRGGSALYDATLTMCRDLAAAGGRLERRILLVLTDGEDTNSKHTLEAVSECAERAGVIIYTIQSGDASSSSREASRVLHELSVAGLTFEPEGARGLSRALKELASDLRSQYLVIYRPADLRFDGKLRRVKISVSNSELRVRAQRGYYAPKGSGK